ncbi:MAG: bacterial transcriptional activator domain-containing protein, partial [Chloroflexota bacterium]
QALRQPEQTAKFVLVEAGAYWLDTTRFQIDVDEFDALLTQARSANDETASQRYEQVIALYQGPYLENMPYYDWAMPERRRLDEAYLAALSALADYYAGNARYREALDLTLRALQSDPLREESHCAVLRYYAALGDRSGLVRHYQQVQQILRTELDLPPLPATQTLYKNLLEGP